jgi:Zn-dependent protease with chaperone function/uncharacterized tellurite resistance protein B-like protein
VTAVQPALDALAFGRERALRSELLAAADVRYALRKVDEAHSGYGFASRRALLTSALRITRSMAPDLADMLAHCKRTLGFAAPVELYVRQEPVFNACAIRAVSGPQIVVLSSRMLEAFSPSELCFVVGHELGHLALGHFALPMPATAKIEDMAGRMVSHENALKLFLWCRAAELSADRMGLLCARDARSAASGFFKLASGLASARVESDLESYAAQVSSLAASPEARKRPHEADQTLDCFSTHPYSPVRVRAILAFERSRRYRSFAKLGEDGLDDAEVEALIERDLALMEPSYLEEHGEHPKRLRRFLYCAGVSVAAADHAVSPSELEALGVLLGHDAVDSAPDPERARNELGALANEVRDDNLARRAQLVQHLTIIASADGTVDARELFEMERIAGLIGIDPSVVHQTLHGAAHPLD